MADKQEIFLELYEQCRESLVRYARSIARNNEDTKDLIQETTLIAYERFESLKNHKAFTSFLFTIASRINKRKNWRKKLFFKFSTPEEENSIYDNLVEPNSNTDSNHDIEALHIALSMLPDKQREAVVLHEIIGLSMEEITEIQGGSISGVKSRVQRGRKELERILLTDKSKKNQMEFIKNRDFANIYFSYRTENSLIDCEYYKSGVVNEK